jgi:hypothetical protein
MDSKLIGRLLNGKINIIVSMGLQDEAKNYIKFLSKITKRKKHFHGYDPVSWMALRYKRNHVRCWTVSTNCVPEMPGIQNYKGFSGRVKYLTVNKVILKMSYRPELQNTDCHIVHLLQIILLILVKLQTPMRGKFY